jgi:molecular chaperone DnaK
MSGRIAVDFGTSNTLLAKWDESLKEGLVQHLPDFSRAYQQGNEAVWVIPSLIHYAEDQRRWLGNQVIEQNLYQSPRTFRWMKRYISNRSPMKILIDGKGVTPFQAGKDFLASVLLFARQELALESDEEIALSVPVEAYEHYENWLVTVADEAGFPRFRLIDEPSAAALGYGAHIQPGSVYLIFDFGGGTMHAAVILIESEESNASGRRCRILGKAGKSTGGATIDQWLYEELLKVNLRSEGDSEIRQVSNALLIECERAKERLSTLDQINISAMNPQTGSIIGMNLTRATFEEILDQHDMFAQIQQTIRSALNIAREHGYEENMIQAVLMVGGSSQIPSVQRVLRQMFGRERVFSDHPMDAVVRGSAAFIAGVDFYDHIQHDYAIRYINPTEGNYEYRVLVQRGTAYPTNQPVARLAIKASYDGQNQLGIAIFEMGNQRSSTTANPLEILFDPSGAARVVQITPHEEEMRRSFWMNQNNPTFLTADPPAKQSEARFEVEFSIDANKRLTMKARDLLVDKLIYNDYPVVKLT